MPDNMSKVFDFDMAFDMSLDTVCFTGTKQMIVIYSKFPAKWILKSAKIVRIEGESLGQYLKIEIFWDILEKVGEIEIMFYPNFG